MTQAGQQQEKQPSAISAIDSALTAHISPVQVREYGNEVAPSARSAAPQASSAAQIPASQSPATTQVSASQRPAATQASASQQPQASHSPASQQAVATPSQASQQPAAAQAFVPQQHAGERAHDGEPAAAAYASQDNSPATAANIPESRESQQTAPLAYAPDEQDALFRAHEPFPYTSSQFRAELQRCLRSQKRGRILEVILAIIALLLFVCVVLMVVNPLVLVAVKSFLGSIGLAL